MEQQAGQHPIEVILAQRLASHLAMPVFLVGANGDLLYYNEPAEALLGYRFDESGKVPKDVWATLLTPRDVNGAVLPAEEMPVVRALERREPVHMSMGIEGLDGVQRQLAVTAFPLECQGGRHLGALAIFWEDLQ